jgi:hypothetical protein
MFEETSLHMLGLVLSLGHNGKACLHPSELIDFQVIAMTGIHHVKIAYCSCRKPLAKYQQLLHEGLFPAMEKHPQTATTFDMLETFHKLTLSSKVNLYDFYLFILHCRDPLRTHHVLVSFIYDSMRNPVMISISAITYEPA